MTYRDDQLLRKLRALRQSVGSPTLRAIQQCGGPAMSTASEMLSGRRPPSPPAVQRFTRACLKFGQDHGIAAPDERDVLASYGLLDGGRPSALLERGTELAACAEQLRLAADQRQGGLMMIEGPIGIGKSAMLRHLRAASFDLGLTTLATRGTELSQYVSLSATRHLLSKWVGATAHPEQGALPALAPKVLRLPPFADGAGEAAWSTGDATEAFDALTQVLDLQTRTTGAVLFIDDAHWVDGTSLRWLLHLSGRLDQLPVCVVLARRTHERTSNEDVVDRLAGSAALRLQLALLSETAVAELVRRRSGTPCDDAFAAACHRRSGGNPLFLEQLLREVDVGRITPDERSVQDLEQLTPVQVVHIVTTRIAQAGWAAQAFVRALAVLGGPAVLARVATLADLAQGTAAIAMDHLCAAGVLTDGPDVDFVHGLFRDAVYQGLPPSERSGTHLRVARLLHAEGAGAQAVGAHLLPVLADGDAWVVARQRSAARSAMSDGAATSAVRYLRRALVEPPAEAELPSVRLELGRALTHTSLPDAHEQLFLAHREAVDDETRTQAALDLCKAYTHADRMGDGVRFLDDAVAASTTAESRQRLVAEQLLWAMFWTDDPARAERSARLRDLAEATTRADPTGQTLLALHAWDLLLRGEPRRRCLDLVAPMLGSEITFIGERLGFDTPTVAGFVALFAEELDVARPWFTDAVVELRDAGWSGTHLAFTQSHVAGIALRQGRLADAEADAGIALRVADRLGATVPATWYALGGLLDAMSARGFSRQGRRLAEHRGYGQQQPNAFIAPNPRVVYAQLLAATGDRAGAETVLAEVGGWLSARAVTNPSFAAWRPALAVLLRRTAPDRAAEEAKIAMAQADRFGAESMRAQTRLARALISPRDAVELAEEAVACARRSPNRFVQAQASIRLGQALLARRHGPDARAELLTGLRLARSCHANGLAAATLRLLARTAPLTSAASELAAQSPPCLTLPAEQLRAAVLIVGGRTDTEAAREMALSREQFLEALHAAQRTLGAGDPVALKRALGEHLHRHAQ
jgi:hypothetical protein